MQYHPLDVIRQFNAFQGPAITNCPDLLSVKTGLNPRYDVIESERAVLVRQLFPAHQNVVCCQRAVYAEFQVVDVLIVQQPPKFIDL